MAAKLTSPFVCLVYWQLSQPNLVSNQKSWLFKYLFYDKNGVKHGLSNSAY